MFCQEVFVSVSEFKAEQGDVKDGQQVNGTLGSQPNFLFHSLLAVHTLSFMITSPYVRTHSNSCCMQ